MKPFSIIEAPLVVELNWSGISLMPRALRCAGLPERLKARITARLAVPAWQPRRDPDSHILNTPEVKDYLIRLSYAVEKDLSDGYFPVVIGGDCTILLGCLLALKKMGRSGLFFIDGHADYFYPPESSPTGETADMDLALATGRGPDILTNMEGQKPLVQESDVVLFGYRDEPLSKQFGVPDVRESDITCISLKDIHTYGFGNSTGAGIKKVSGCPGGFWIHVDFDVLDDMVMPAVDYRLPGGLSFGELISTLRRLVTTGKALGIDVSIFNPTLDPDGEYAEALVDLIVKGLEPYSY